MILNSQAPASLGAASSYPDLCTKNWRAWNKSLICRRVLVVEAETHRSE